jgi:multidrug transporter EmrE-like cation transporter
MPLAISLLAVAFICSFSTLKLAMNDIPMGTAYATWSGIGTANRMTSHFFLVREISFNITTPTTSNSPAINKIIHAIREADG